MRRSSVGCACAGAEGEVGRGGTATAAVVAVVNAVGLRIALGRGGCGAVGTGEEREDGTSLTPLEGGRPRAKEE